MNNRFIRLLLLLVIMMPICVSAQTRCEFYGFFKDGTKNSDPAGSVVFDDNNIVVYLKERSRELSYSNDPPIKYLPNMADELSKFNERGMKCPKWLVKYGISIKFNMFWADEEAAKDSLVANNTGFFKQSQVFEFADNSKEQSHVIEDDTYKKYTKEYHSIAYGNEYGDLIFEVSYDRDADDFRGHEVYFTKKENIDIKIIDNSIDSFKQKMRAVAKGGYNIANFYCAKRNATNNPYSKAVSIDGESIANGDIFCSLEQGHVLGNKVMIFSTDIVPPEKEEEEEEEVDDSDGDWLTPIDPGNNYDVTIGSICTSSSYRKTTRIVGLVFSWICILVPIVVIGFGVYDLYKAMIQNDAGKAVSGSIKSIVIRVLAGVVIFLLPGIIEFILGLVNTWNSGNANYDYSKSWACCAECVFDSKCDANVSSSNYCK